MPCRARLAQATQESASTTDMNRTRPHVHRRRGGDFSDRRDGKDLGKFRVPSLREVGNTGPYFHDGSCDSLEKAVAMMAGGGMDNPNLSALLKGIGAKGISAEDQASIAEFLRLCPASTRSSDRLRCRDDLAALNTTKDGAP